MVTDYQAILASLYGVLESLDATAYRHGASDGWTQARVPLQWTAHLQAYIDLGSTVTLTAPAWEYGANLAFACRYVAGSSAVTGS